MLVACIIIVVGLGALFASVLMIAAPELLLAPFSRRARQTLREGTRKIDAEADVVNKLGSGQSIVYKLPEYYWTTLGGFLIVEGNPDYPERGRKYNLSAVGIADGKPAANRRFLFDTNSARIMAEFVLDRDGHKEAPVEKPHSGVEQPEPAQ